MNTDKPQPQVEGGGIAAGHDVNISGGQVAGRDINIIQQRVNIPLRWSHPAESDPLHRWARAVGRRAELGELRHRLRAGGRTALTAAVAGTPAIGKTTLASMLAHEDGKNYSGGVIWQDLGPMHRDPVRCDLVLNRWAAYAYGGDLAAINERHLQFAPDAVQTLLAGHGPLLFVLDDVWDYEAVLPLVQALPAGACVLMTTREHRIARSFDPDLQRLDKLTPKDALALLRERLPAAPTDLLEGLAETLGRHPLALSIAANDLAAREPHEWSAGVEELARLVDEGGGFGDLPLPDEEARRSEVEAAFFHSYRDLRPEDQRRFRCLGAFAPGEMEFGAEAVSALWGDDLKAARSCLNVLKVRSLAEAVEQRPDRWIQHALLRAYACALLRREGEDADTRSAHLAFYLDLARDWLVGDRKGEFAQFTAELEQYRHAFAWVCSGAPGKLAYFVDRVGQLLLLNARLQDAQQWLGAALATAEANGDVDGQANTLRALGDLSVRRDELEGAQGYYDQALPLYEAIGARLGQANTLKALGDLSVRRDELEGAQGYYDQALPLYEAIGDRLGQANTLKALGELSAYRDELEGAQGYYDQALPLFEAIGSRLGQANTLRGLAELYQEQERWEQALVEYEKALALFAQIQDAYSMAITRRRMAPTLGALGLVGEAIQGILFAQDVYTRIGLAPYLEYVYQSMRDLRDQAGPAAFDAAWDAVVGEAQPDWLQG